jgi:hypothetical protein
MFQKYSKNNHDAAWLRTEIANATTIAPMTNTEVTIQDVKTTIKRMNNWKVVGNDCVQNFWYKCLTNTHAKLALLFNQCILEPQQVSDFFTKGITCLKPKDENTENPSKYGPITCLPTIYNMLTLIISDKLNNHLKMNNIIAEEQKGCTRNCQGCKEQVITDTIITTHAKTKERTYTMHISITRKPSIVYYTRG